MKEPASDALVVFGATGDLAFMKIFPTLHKMVREGRLDVPVVAVLDLEIWESIWGPFSSESSTPSIWMPAGALILASGAGIYYLVRELGCGSWQTVVGAEPGRDSELPMP